MPRVKQIVGLDIGSRNIRAVWVQLQSGRPRVTRAEKMELPLEGGDPVALTRTWLDQLGLTRGFASVAVSGTQIVFQPMRLMPDDPRTPRQAANMECGRFNDMVGDVMVSDLTVFDRPDSTRQILLGMARPTVVKESLSTLESLSVRPTDLVPAPAAFFCGAVSGSEPDPAPVLYIDIGYSKTEISVGCSKGLVFARAFPIGGKHFTDAIAKGGACTVQQAELQKLRDATLESGGAFAEFLEPVAERWYGQLSAVLAAYRSAVSGNGFAITSAVVAGGGAKLRHFREWLAAKSGLSVRPVESLPSPAGLSDLSTYALAYGLALTSLEVPSLPRLSFIPDSLRDEVVFREKKPYWIATAITTALALCVFTGGLVFMLGRESGNLENERQELRAHEKLDKEIAKIREETEVIRKEAGRLRKYLVGGPVSRYVVSLVSTSISPEDWISLVSDEESYLSRDNTKEIKQAPRPMRPGFYVPGFRDNDSKAKMPSESFSKASAKPAPQSSCFKVFIVEGYTPNMGFGSLNDMLRRIRSGERVKSADLLPDDSVKEPEKLPEQIKSLNLPEMRRFVIRLEVSEP